jgi:hypothetical protein
MMMQNTCLITILLLISSINSLNNKLVYISSKLRDLESTQGFLLIDGDNCRGKANFQLSKQELAGYVHSWLTSTRSLCRPILFFDHGQNLSAYWCSQVVRAESDLTRMSVQHSQNTSITSADASESSPKLSVDMTMAASMPLVVSFSGVSLTVDDCIVKDLQFIQNILKRDVCVITEDQELRSRCRKNTMSSSSAIRSRKKRVKQIEKIKTMRIESGYASVKDISMKTLSTIDSRGFMEYLYEFLGKTLQDRKIPTNVSRDMQVIKDDSNKQNSSLNAIKEELLRQQVALQRSLQVLEETLDTTTSRRIEMKLKISCASLQAKLDGLISTYQRLDDWDDSNMDREYDIYEEGQRLFRRLAADGKSIQPVGVNGAEETWERVILAEKFRQELIQQQSVELAAVSKLEISSTPSRKIEDDDNGDTLALPVTVSENVLVSRNQELQAYIEHVERNSHLHPNRKRGGYSQATLPRSPTKKTAKGKQKRVGAR